MQGRHHVNFFRGGGKGGGYVNVGPFTLDNRVAESW